MSSRVKLEQTVTRGGSLPTSKAASPVRKRLPLKSKPVSKEGDRSQLDASKGESAYTGKALVVKKMPESQSMLVETP